jgi:DNA invertase Pin-like site-specific DNA recombinase
LDQCEKIKVAAYCRVSTDKDDQIASLENQKTFFEEYARIHNYDLVKLYTDEGISGTKLKKRKAFNRMLADARLGKFEMVFVKDISRFARNAVDFLTSIRELNSLGIKCYFVNSNLSTNDGEFALGILALVAQEESANMSKRVKFGKSKNAALGKVPNIVYGYDKTPGELFNLKINEYEASIIRRIYNMYINTGIGTNKAAQILNSEGIKTKRGCHWTSNAVSRILSNPIYTGTIINGKEEVKDFLTGVRTKNPKEKWHITENSSLAIISKETFKKSQNLLKQRKTSFKIEKKRESCKYPLSTLIKCASCGYSFRRIYRRYKYGEYIKWSCCGRNTYGKDFCNNTTNVDEKELIESICGYLCGIVSDKDSFIKDICDELEKKIKSSYPSDTSSIKKRLSELKRAKSRQTKMYEAEIITLDELKERTSELNMEIKKYNALLKNTDNEVESKKQEKLIKSYCKNIETLLPEILDNHMLKRIIEKILVNDNGEVEIYLRLYSPSELKSQKGSLNTILKNTLF